MNAADIFIIYIISVYLIDILNKAIIVQFKSIWKEVFIQNRKYRIIELSNN
jgi:hypothetical protein